jgi:hypothetical protein
MARLNICECGEQTGFDAWVFLFEHSKHFFYLHPFLVLVSASRTGTAGDRETSFCCVMNNTLLRHIYQRTDNHIPPIISMQEWGHSHDSTVVELIEQQRLDKIFPVVAEGHLRASTFPGLRIQYASLYPGTERAGRVVGRKFLEHKLVNRRGHNMVLNIMLPKIMFHRPCLEAWKARMNRDGNERKGYWSTLSQAVQYVEQCPTVFAARERDEDTIVVIDHAEIADSLAHKPADVMFHSFYGAHAKNAKTCGPISQYFCWGNAPI